nr:DoxX family protein [Ktedonobacteraceae bacterium]
MNIALWMVQIVLALVFVRAGFPKVSQPVEKLRARWNWTKHVAPLVIRLIGSLEILGALGLIVPKATGYLPWLTPVAAVGLVLTMMGAILTHVRLHDEAKVVGVNLVLMLLALFIAMGYFVFVPVV